MSFTAQVKDELSRVEGACPTCAHAQLSAIVRVCGTLSLRGPGRYSIRVSTETGAVARTMIKLTHELFDLETRLTVRHSNLHKVRNYLIEIPEQDELEDDLVRMGILVLGTGLAAGVPAHLLERPCCRAAFVRGAFMAGGFVADPRGDFHLEIAVTGERFANDIVALIGELGAVARLNRRRGTYAIYLKSFDDVVTLLRAMGAHRSARAVESVRRVKSLKNEVNRLVNAELANQARMANAAGTQLELIGEAARLIGMGRLPPAVREFCELRLAHPDLSLADLGALASPPTKKSGMYHRLLRLRDLVNAARADT
ncbi:MAG: DNA-binding protein WhiA [Acidobacteriota bacterium]|nr:DNA-binding protein WhiA [Acidobacteriota bacterium]